MIIQCTKEIPASSKWSHFNPVSDSTELNKATKWIPKESFLNSTFWSDSTPQTPVQKRGCVVICTSRHRKQKNGNDIHPRSLTSQFAPEKWMESCFPFWIRCFIRLSGASCYKLRGSSGSVHKVDSFFISPKNWGKKTMPNFTGREKLSNKNFKFHFLYKLHLFNWNLPFNIVDDAITTGDSWYLRSLDEKRVGPSTWGKNIFVKKMIW